MRIVIFLCCICLLETTNVGAAAEAKAPSPRTPRLNLEWRWAPKEKPTPNHWRDQDSQLAKMRQDSPDEYRQIVLVTQIALGAFGLGTGPFDGALDNKTRRAIANYQKARGLSPTTELDARTFDALMRDFKLYQDIGMLTTLTLPPLVVVDDLWNEGYVTAEGTWTLTAGDHNYVTWVSRFPLQTTKIECRRQDRICIESHAKILYDGSAMRASTDIHPIERWDRSEIRTAREWSCGRYVMLVRRTTEAVTASCKGARSEYHVTLGSGVDVILQLRQEMSEELRGVVQVPNPLAK